MSMSAHDLRELYRSELLPFSFVSRVTAIDQGRLDKFFNGNVQSLSPEEFEQVRNCSLRTNPSDLETL